MLQQNSVAPKWQVTTFKYTQLLVQKKIDTQLNFEQNNFSKRN